MTAESPHNRYYEQDTHVIKGPLLYRLGASIRRPRVFDGICSHEDLDLVSD